MKTQIVPKCGICGQDAHNHSENKKGWIFYRRISDTHKKILELKSCCICWDCHSLYTSAERNFETMSDVAIDNKARMREAGFDSLTEYRIFMSLKRKKDKFEARLRNSLLRFMPV